MKPLRAVGLGSPFGDDRVGWLAVEALGRPPWSERLPAGVSLLTLDRPGVALVQAFLGAQAVVLVDGIQSGAEPGSLHRLAGYQWVPAAPSLSSHDLGVAAAIRLAQALGQLPDHLVLLGMEIGGSRHPATLSRPVRQGLPKLVQALAAELERIQPAPRGGRP